MFRIADPEEIFKPQRFKHLYWDSKWMKKTHITAVASTILGRDEMDERLHAMRDKNERHTRVPQSGTEERLPHLKHERGKG